MAGFRLEEKINGAESGDDDGEDDDASLANFTHGLQ